jgi:hypothetical protein
VLAVIEPLVVPGPKAETQSPTASALEVTLCVALTGVELEVVTLSVWTLGAVTFLDLLELLDLVALVFGACRGKLPGDTEMPEMVIVDPLTAVTLPEAIEMFPSNRRKLPDGAPFAAPDRLPPPKPGPPPWAPPPFVRKNCPPPGGPPAELPVPKKPRPPTEVPVQAPLLLGMVTVRFRAAIVVFDFFDGVPVAVTQSPTAIALTDSFIVLENWVVVVQLTVV